MPETPAMTKREAEKIVFDFIASQGYKGKINWLTSYEARGRWCLEFTRPYGMFAVDAEGRVDDNYNYFSKEMVSVHEPDCGCNYCIASKA